MYYLIILFYITSSSTRAFKHTHSAPQVENDLTTLQYPITALYTKIMCTLWDYVHIVHAGIYYSYIPHKRIDGG